MKRQPPAVVEAIAKPIPFPLVFERVLLGALAALIVARPLVIGDDPGRLRLTSGGGPVSFNLCIFLLLVAAGVWRVAFARTRPACWLFALPALALAAVGVAAYWSSRNPDRYARPGLFIAWEWVALAVIVYLVRRLAASVNDNRGLLNVLLASAVSVGGLGIYQSAMAPLGLPKLDVTAPDPKSELAGNDEFYPELSRPPNSPSAIRGTFDSSETLLLLLFLTLPAALAIWKAGRFTRRGQLLLLVPGVLAIAIVVTLLSGPFDAAPGHWSAAFRLLEQFPLLGVGPGNLSRMTPAADSPHSAWLELAVTTGLVGFALFALAVAVAVWQAWPRGQSAVESVPAISRWEFHLGGAAGLVLGFVWAFGEVPAEAPASEVFTLGAAAVFRAILWFAAFAILETARTPSRSLIKAILIGVAFVIVYGFVSDSPGRQTLLFPMFVMLAIAANLRGPRSEKPDGPWSKPSRVVSVLLAAGLAIAYLLIACLPAWATASAVRQARMASRIFPERDREVDRALPGPQKANALTNARGFLLANIINPLREASDRDPGNAALKLEIIRWERPLWRYQLYADPEQAARLAREMLESAQVAEQLDPHNLASKRNMLESLLLFRRTSGARETERLVAMNKLIRQIAEREPESEVPLRYRMVQALFEHGDPERLQSEVTTLLRLSREEGAPHGALTPGQKAEVIERARTAIKDLSREVIEQWSR
jgi:hypothetical protein